jgi:predicted membrane-bound mannosyltransferase
MFLPHTISGRNLNGCSAATADDFTVGGVIVPQHLEVSAHVGGAALMVDQTFFVANRAYQVVAVSFVSAVAEATAGSLSLQVVKDTSTNAPGAGTNLLTNNTNAGFNCKSTANTVQTGTLSTTASDLQLAAGDRLALDFSAGATELVGVTVTVTLKRI